MSFITEKNGEIIIWIFNIYFIISPFFSMLRGVHVKGDFDFLFKFIKETYLQLRI